MTKRRALRVHTIPALAVLGTLAIIALLFLPLSPTSAPLSVTEAADDDKPLTGYAWSSNIGWISFRGTAKNGFPYGVVLEDDKDLTGYAWSSNIGWIKFGGNSGCPDGGSCDAKLSGNNLVGWAKAIAGDGSAQAGGWDGWIKLSGTAADGGSYGVTKYDIVGGLNDGKSSLTGFAWGGEVIGWVDFSPNIKGVAPSNDYCTTRVCIDKPGSAGNPILESCGGVVNNMDITWTATISGGQPSDTYSWSGTDGLSGTTNPITKTYLTNGIKIANIAINSGAFQYCSMVNLGNVPIEPIELTVTPGHGTVTILNQASGQPASSFVRGGENPVLAAQITNKPTAGAGTVTIESIKSQSSDLDLSDPSILGEQPKCYFQRVDYTPGGSFVDCNSVSSVFLNPSESVYFRIQVPKRLKAIADDNPYDVTISAKNIDGADANPVTIIFDYLVGTFDQI